MLSVKTVHGHFPGKPRLTGYPIDPVRISMQDLFGWILFLMPVGSTTITDS